MKTFHSTKQIWKLAGLLALVIILTLVLTTCGDDDDDDNDDDATEDVWEDSVSGLMWQNDSALHDRSGERRNYCPNLNWGGYNDWRLPTISELRSLIRGCDATETGSSCGVMDSCQDSSCQDDSCTTCSVGEGPESGCYWPSELKGYCSLYWSDSVVENAFDISWYIGFDDGNIYGGDCNNNCYVRCVR